MTDFFFTKTAAELQANHDKVGAVNGGIVGDRDDFQPPRNNDWNGYLDPEHQSRLPSDPINGYPGSSGGGEVVYAADEEISYGIYAGSGGATVSSDSDGWIFTGSIYRPYDYTTAQLADIDINAAPAYLKGQDGSEYFANNATTGVNVTKPDANTLKIEITDAIFAELGITKLWRWFDTERVGRVVELSVDSIIERMQEKLKAARTLQDVSGFRAQALTYTNEEAYPIDIVVYGVSTTSNRTLTIDGVQTDSFHTSASASVMTIRATIQPGQTYSVANVGATPSWHELRI